MAKTKEKDVKETSEVKTTTTVEQPQPELTAKDHKEIKIIERVIDNREIVPHDAFGKLNRSQIELIKRTYAKGASDDELKLFITACHGMQLSPFSKQVHLVPRWDAKEGREVRAIQVGIDGLRATAEKTGKYAGNDDPIYDGEQEIEFTVGKDSKEKKKITVPEKATTTVYKMVEGQRYAFTATARWNEYYPGPRMGFQWHTRPYLMLGKCAEALALRKSFPSLLSGIYTPEEMDRTAQVDTDDKKVKQGFAMLMDMVNTMSLPEAKDWKSKIEKSTKYTEDQKVEFLEAVDKRIKELSNVDKKVAEAKQ